LASALAERRGRAAELAKELELPTFKGRPGWEFTDISGLDLAAYAPAGDAATNGSRADAVAPLFDLPETVDLPDGVIVSTIGQAATEQPDLIERHLGSLVEVDDLFVARNDAGFQDSAFVYVPAGVALEAPIVLTSVQAGAGTELGRRTLVVIEDGAQAEVWEQFLSAEAELDGLFNVVTELVVGQGARLRYVCGQSLSEKSWIFGAQRAEVGRDAYLAGEGAEARVTGAYASHGRQHIDFDTTQEHAAPNTTSDLAFRGVLQDRSSAVWKGNIIVDPGAQKTDAFQESRNLLLSKRSHADAIPGLEIQANDVRCTHAAAVAQVDPEQLFYLRSRGLREEVAKRLVIEGFLAALVERFEPGPVREQLAGALEQRLALVLGVDPDVLGE
jgi:Fe-S cluster assembly protein SufD